MYNADAVANKWSFTKKLFFRFFASYFIVFIFPFPTRFFPVLNILNKWYNSLFTALVSFTGKNIFHINSSLAATTNGSGDTTFDYIHQLLLLIIAMIAAVTWSVADRKRKNYNIFLYWLVFYMRYYLGLTMLLYGFEKIIKTQFPFPYYSLNETYGQSTPMRLLWTFMGYSKTFNVFIGLNQVIAGALVLFRRSTMLGAMLCSFILSNVVLMNFCFDVPVKLFSSNLLLIAVFILVPDANRLADFFLRNKPVPAAATEPKFSDARMQTIWFVVKFTVIVAVTYLNIVHTITKNAIQGDAAFKRTPLFGVYNVEKFVKNNDTSQQVSADPSQWKSLNIIFPKEATIGMMNDSIKLYSFFTDTINKKIKLYIHKNSADQSTLTYYLVDSTHLVLNGTLNGDSVYILLQKQDLNKLPLLNRKFHWINEYPYNK